jgi:hypothetical protein
MDGDRVSATRWKVLIVTLGAIIALAPVIVVFEGLPPLADVGPVAVGAVLLFVPYAILATKDDKVDALSAAALFLLLLGTIIGVVIASRSSTGALAFVWILPLQVAVAVFAVRRRARMQKREQQRSRDSTTPTTRRRIVTGAAAAFAFLAAIFVLFFTPSLWHVGVAVVFGAIYANRDRL